MKKVLKSVKGITLIALVITIIVILIISGIVINMITDNNGVLNKATNAKLMYNLGALREEIDLYVMNSEMEEIEGIEKYPVIKTETMNNLSDKEKEKLPTKLKSQLASLVAKDGEMQTIENIDYGKIYKIDSSKVASVKSFSGDLYLLENESGYKVISVNGEVYNKEKINIIIPLNNIEDPKYITVANNTYKLYGDGRLKVIGEASQTKTGITSEQSNIYGIEEFNLDNIDVNKVIARSNSVETDNEVAKSYGVKKIYFHTNTAYVIDVNDDLWAWGDNSYNKLGQGNSYLVTEPTKILEGRTEGATGVKAKNVWAGATNTYVLDTNNQLWACGTNVKGELGQGNTDLYKNFVKVEIDGLDLNTVNIEEIQLSLNIQYSSVTIKCDNGDVYGCGNNYYGQFGMGDNKNRVRFVNLGDYDDKWNNADDIISEGIMNFVLKNNTLYGCGYNVTHKINSENNSYIDKLVELETDVEKITYFINYGYAFIKTDGTIWLRNNGVTTQITCVQGTDVQLGGIVKCIKNNEVYNLSTQKKITTYDKYGIKKLLDVNVRGFIGNNNRIYLEEYPNIVTPKIKAILSLKEILNDKDITFVQGNGGYINIVDKEGNVYGNVSGNKISDLNNIKKIIVSSTSSYAIDKDGYLYAKGNERTGLWGEIAAKTSYQKITKDGTNLFGSIKDIYTSKVGHSVIFLTNDNKMYWAGSNSYVAIPKIKGDITVAGTETVTKYPKEVTKTESAVLDEIKNKISDIKYSFINAGGIYGSNTLILTTEGTLYTYSYYNKNMTGIGRTTDNDFEELKINGNTPVKQVETMDGLSLALLENGDVYGWGYNTYGILGEGYETGGIYSTPVKLKLSNISYISLGEGFAIFANKSGEVYGIGKNDYGQLGTGDTKGADNFVRCTNLEE